MMRDTVRRREATPHFVRAVALVAYLGMMLVPRAAAGLPMPIPQASQTPPPDLAAPSPTPLPLLASGQVIDIERGFIVFTSGDALRLAPDAVFVDATTGQPLAAMPAPGIFASATIEDATGLVVSVRFSKLPLPQGTPVAQLPRKFVVAASSPQPNPELAPPKSNFVSKLSRNTLTRITVQVPPNTPFDADVFMATDTSGWNPQAVKMQRVDALHFTIALQLATGTQFHFLFTRGSWQTQEVARNGLERPARALSVQGADLLRIEATIYRWTDLR